MVSPRRSAQLFQPLQQHLDRHGRDFGILDNRLIEKTRELHKRVDIVHVKLGDLDSELTGHTASVVTKLDLLHGYSKAIFITGKFPEPIGDTVTAAVNLAVEVKNEAIADLYCSDRWRIFSNVET